MASNQGGQFKAVTSAMDGLAAKLKAIAIVDGPNTNDESVIAYFTNFGSKRVFAVDPWLKVWDTVSGCQHGAGVPVCRRSLCPDQLGIRVLGLALEQRVR
jgi:phage tail sheath protein FI